MILSVGEQVGANPHSLWGRVSSQMNEALLRSKNSVVNAEPGVLDSFFSQNPLSNVNDFLSSLKPKQAYDLSRLDRFPQAEPEGVLDFFSSISAAQKKFAEEIATALPLKDGPLSQEELAHLTRAGAQFASLIKKYEASIPSLERDIKKLRKLVDQYRNYYPGKCFNFSCREGKILMMRIAREEFAPELETKSKQLNIDRVELLRIRAIQTRIAKLLYQNKERTFPDSNPPVYVLNHEKGAIFDTLHLIPEARKYYDMAFHQANSKEDLLQATQSRIE